MYKIPTFQSSNLKGVTLKEGETIETKVERMLTNKEPIKDGAPLIFTERKDGVLAAYNIRSDRWELAAEAMDKVTASKIATREAKMKEAEEAKEAKIIKLKDGEAEPTAGKAADQNQQSR